MPSFVSAISTPEVSQTASEANTPPQHQVGQPPLHSYDLLHRKLKILLTVICLMLQIQIGSLLALNLRWCNVLYANGSSESLHRCLKAKVPCLESDVKRCFLSYASNARLTIYITCICLFKPFKVDKHTSRL